MLRDNDEYSAGAPTPIVSSTQEQDQKKIFDQQFGTYTRYQLQSWQEFYLARIFNALQLQADDVFLDVGVGGSGCTVIEVAQYVRSAVGVDLSSEGIRKATEFSQARRLTNVRFEVASAEALPFPDETFTKLCSIAVLEHVENDGRAFDEIRRVLKPGGIIHICVPNSYLYMPLLLSIANVINDKKVGHLRHYYANDMIRAFEARGFSLKRLEYHAHSVKLVSYAVEMIPMFRRIKNPLLRWLDNIDCRNADDPRAMNFSITMIKER